MIYAIHQAQTNTFLIIGLAIIITTLSIVLVARTREALEQTRRINKANEELRNTYARMLKNLSQRLETAEQERKELRQLYEQQKNE